MKNDFKVALFTPPFTQLNTPYPATAYIKGFLNTLGINSFQADLGIDVILKLFTKTGLEQLFEYASCHKDEFSENCNRIYSLKHKYISTIDGVIQFLQHKNNSLLHAICSGNYLPQASRFAHTEDFEWAFGTMGNQDKARHIATLYLEDLSDFIVENVDSNFGFTRYAEKLGRSANTFTELDAALQQKPSFIDAITLPILKEYIDRELPNLVAFSVPFPGNLYAAFKCAQYIKSNYPTIKLALGGGFPNTELRSLSEPKVFDYFDFISLDDGERPFQVLIEHLQNKRPIELLKRTFVRIGKKVQFIDGCQEADVAQKDTGVPDYSDLNLTKYLSVIEIANPMHSLWSNGRWNKLTLAHGCYWGKCTFCDTSLDYIRRYEPLQAKMIVDKMEVMIAQTGEIGFHFVDEAAPPALLKELAIELLKRNLSVVWWTNIRFEKNFSKDLCKLLALSGCIAVSGGLEVASDRLLNLIQKGVTVPQVANVTNNFTSSGIMVHAYLMYGYPTQTEQETIDSLEIVRQLFAENILQSGFWHQFALTAHSPIGLLPDEYTVTIETPSEISFANNDLIYTEKNKIDHSNYAEGLRISLFNYMRGVGIDLPLSNWFTFKIPKTTIPKNHISTSIQSPVFEPIPNHFKLYWMAKELSISPLEGKQKKNLKCNITIQGLAKSITVELELEHTNWLKSAIDHFNLIEINGVKYSDFQAYFNQNLGETWPLFWYHTGIIKLRESGIILCV